jgi:hypothetical protein
MNIISFQTNNKNDARIDLKATTPLCGGPLYIVSEERYLTSLIF